MPNVTIYYNPSCSKSRQALALIEAQGIVPKVIEYLKNPPTTTELKIILSKLKRSPRELVRTKEKRYTELALNDTELSDVDLIKAMVKHPILIERPIVVCGNKACLGRPSENILEVL